MTTNFYRLSGLSPFAGECDQETYTNITSGYWDFDDPSFGQISEDAKDFIEKLLVIEMKLVDITF